MGRDVEAAVGAPEGGGSRACKVGTAYKVYGAFAIASGILTFVVDFVVVLLALIAVLTGYGHELFDDVIERYNTSTIVILVISTVVGLVLAMGYVRLGVGLLKNRSRHAGTLANSMIALAIFNLLCHLMLRGVSLSIVVPIFNIAALIVISTFVDPALAQERELQRTLRDMEYREQEAAGGRDVTGEGYITLNFFNLFWIFVITCVLGLVVEEVYHAIVYGGYQDRAGMLYGPFSPIYGLGAVLMTVALNRFYRSNPLIIFVVSALIGGAFEYLVSWFFQYAFGITAWDYSGPWFNEDGSINPITFMNIDGRTSLLFMIFWGIMGLCWIKLALPPLLRLINLIPWNVRYAVTAVAAVLMIADGALTLIACDCWYERVAGRAPAQPIEQFCARHYDNGFMQNRFQTMSIDPSNTTRVD